MAMPMMRLYERGRLAVLNHSRLCIIISLLIGSAIHDAHSFVPNAKHLAVKPHLCIGQQNNALQRCRGSSINIFRRQKQDTERGLDEIKEAQKQTDVEQAVRLPTIKKFWDREYRSSMGNLDFDNDDDDSEIEVEEAKDENDIALLLGVTTVLGAATVASMGYFDFGETVNTLQHFFQNPTSVLEDVVVSVEAMGNLGFLYFGAVYTVAEILAIPAIPLTASAGYLFGVRDGTIVVLISASIAAATSFLIGRTLLRSYVEKALEDYPKFKKIDRAIGKEGFKLMLLLRLSPIFPFALSNYLYGVTSVRFWPFFFGTLVGFSPGTVAYVYTGEIGKALTLESTNSEPWYFYAGGLALLSLFIKVVADVATGIIDDLDEDDEE